MNTVIAVTSCWKYRDTWGPFFTLKSRFWTHALDKKTVLLTDHFEAKLDWFYPYQPIVRTGSWTEILAKFTRECVESNTLIILLQDDFFINAPVNNWLIDRAEHLMLTHNAGCVRLFPCPGGHPYIFHEAPDPHFGIHIPGMPYLISCQGALWRPDYLLKVLENVKGTTAADFEIQGTEYAQREPGNPIFAVRKGVAAIPYVCSAVSRGKWNPAALAFAKECGIEVDMSLREVE